MYASQSVPCVLRSRRSLAGSAFPGRAWERGARHSFGPDVVILWSLGSGVCRMSCELQEPMGDVTQILRAIDAGDGHAAEQLLPLVYEELRRLAAHRLASEKPGQTLQGTAPALGGAVSSRAARAGTIIGRYTLLKPIGEGGMGVVYLAEQSEPVHRQVALKIIKPGMDTHEVIARFEAERQALALMDWPHIARVYDAGETPEGLPYFVMELVQGVPKPASRDIARPPR